MIGFHPIVLFGRNILLESKMYNECVRHTQTHKHTHATFARTYEWANRKRCVDFILLLIVKQDIINVYRAIYTLAVCMAWPAFGVNAER